MAGVAFKKTFSYAGFEMQRKHFENPRIAMLNVELELKSEKENAELRIDNVEVCNSSRQAIVVVGVCIYIWVSCVWVISSLVMGLRTTTKA